MPGMGSDPWRCRDHRTVRDDREKAMTIGHATSSNPAPKRSRRAAARRRSVESDRTSDEADAGRERSSVERVPADDREHEEIGPQAGYGGGPDEGETEH